MENYIRKLKASSYFKSLIALTSGSLIGAVIIALRQVLQTRIFSANEIGIYTFLLAIPTMFIGVMSLRYEVSIITERDEHKVFSLIKLTSILIIIMGIIISFFYFFYIYIYELEYRKYLYVTPFIFLIVTGYGLYNMVSSYNNRLKEYKLISKMYILRTFVQHGGVLLLGYTLVVLANLTELSILIMLAPYSFGLFAGIFRQSKSLLIHKEEIKIVTVNDMIEVAKIYWRQPVISTPALFLNSFSFSIITIIIGNLYNTTVLGYYSVSNQILGMPISLIAGNVAKIFIQKASIEYHSTGKFNKAYKQSVAFLSSVSIIMFLLMYFVAPSLSEVIFGQGWSAAGIYIKILAPMFCFRLIGTSISQGLVVCNEQKIEFLFNILMVTASLSSGAIAWMRNGDEIMFLTILSFTKSLCYIWLIITVYYFASGKSFKKKSN